MEERVRISTVQNKIKVWSFFIGSLIVFMYSALKLSLDIGKFISRLSNAGNVLIRMMVVDVSAFPEIISEMLVSISIAIVGLVIGMVIAFVLAMLAAKNITPNKYLAMFIKGAVAIIRAIPSLVWILMVVASMGFGNSAGSVGLIISTVGYLTKSFIASIEDIGYDVVEMMRATGASWPVIAIKGVLPCVFLPFLSWISIRLEGNIAESISLGMIGVAGVGTIMNKAIRSYDFGTVSAVIIVIFTTMIAVELGINKFKQKLN